MLTCMTNHSDVHLCVKCVNNECLVQRQTDTHTEDREVRGKRKRGLE